MRISNSRADAAQRPGHPQPVERQHAPLHGGEPAEVLLAVRVTGIGNRPSP